MTDFEEYRRIYLQRLYAIIDTAGDRGVSDIHVLPERGIYYLVSGKLERDTSLIVTQGEILEWMRQPGQVGAADDHLLEPQGHTSLAYDTGRYRVRASYRRTTHGVTVTYRIIPGTIPTPEVLGLPPQMLDMARKASGLILFEGPTGSGKTTAIASLIDMVNRTMNKHIYLIEDPIEFTHEPYENTVITQREIGVHALDFPSGVENALRSKPNVVVIGELLNPATTKAALHAATTGHLVMTTAHAGSITEALDSFIGQFVAEEQPQIRSRLSQSLVGIMVQKLIPSLDGGLIAAREVMTHNRNFRELIASGDSHMIRAQLEGDRDEATGAPRSFSMEESLADLIRHNKITGQMAMEHARDFQSMKEKLDEMGVVAEVPTR